VPSLLTFARWAKLFLLSPAGIRERSRSILRSFYFYIIPGTWALLLLLLIPLEDARPGSAQAAYDHAWNLFLMGRLTDSQQEAEQGYKQFQNSNTEWASRFQILEAEAMLWRGMSDDALRLLAAYPNSTNSDDNVRKLAIQAIALAHKHQLSKAGEKLAQAEYLCKTETLASCGYVFNVLGNLAIMQGNIHEASQHFLGCLSFAQVHNNRFLEASALINLGWIALQIDHFDEAVDWSQNAHRISIEIGAQGLAQASAGNLGWAYFQLGDDERALELFLDAEKSATRLGNLRDELKWISDAGYIYRDTGDSDRAAQSYRRALNLARQINSKEDIVNALEDLARVSVVSGKLDEASAYLDQVTSMESASAKGLSGYVMLTQGILAAARHQDQQAETLFRAIQSNPANPTTTRLGAGDELAGLYELEGNTKAAERTYIITLTAFESARAQLRNENSRLPFAANATGIYDHYIHLLVEQGRSAEALATADQSRARTLAQGLGLAESKTSYHTSQSVLKVQIAEKLSSGAKAHPLFSASCGTTKVVPFQNRTFNTGCSVLNPRQIAQSSGATLLFYWLGSERSYLWAITPAKIALFPLPAQKEIAARVERYRKALLDAEDPQQTGNEDGETLYQLLVAPAAKLIRPNSPVMILADGALNQLNFETLLAPGPGVSPQVTPGAGAHYWIDDQTLLSAPSLELLAAARPAAGGSRKLLLLGNPVTPSPEYPSLPLFGLEMTQIAGHFASRQAAVFAGQQATPAAYLGSNPAQYAYIHFVSHAIASRADPLDSAIILSGSTLSGGRTGEESYKLYAREIMQHPIDARLVTISACYGSGTRSYAGEGLVGLSWAFLRAGAHNVIGALWEVSDDSTPRLMDALYQGLADGQNPASALRRAKLNLLHSPGKFRAPYYWAPFQIYTRR
jgi:CHAT domain-containing protein/Tfp pilus assembly protein PilF